MTQLTPDPIFVAPVRVNHIVNRLFRLVEPVEQGLAARTFLSTVHCAELILVIWRVRSGRPVAWDARGRAVAKAGGFLCVRK